MLLLDARQIGEWPSSWLKDVLSSQRTRTALVQFVIRNPGFRLYDSSLLLALERKNAFPGMQWSPELELAIELIKRLGRIANKAELSRRETTSSVGILISIHDSSC